MPLSVTLELISVLKLIQGGVFLVMGCFYAYTLFFEPGAMSGANRTRYGRLLTALGLSLGVDGVISGLVGGTTSYVQAGGALGPVYVLLLARGVSIGCGLEMLGLSYRLFRHGAR